MLRAQRHLGNVLRLMGRYPEAYKVTEESLARARVALGEDDPTTLSLRTGFGADLRAKGSFAAARDLDTESRVLLERNYGANDPRKLRLLSSLALDHGLVSDYGTAQELFKQAFAEMGRADSGAITLDIIGAWVGISWTLQLLGKYDDALDVAQDARDYGQNSSGLGVQHLYTLRAVNAYLIASRRPPDKRRNALEEKHASSGPGNWPPRRKATAQTLPPSPTAMNNCICATDASDHRRDLELAEATV